MPVRVSICNAASAIRRPSAPSLLTALALLWLAGAAMRLPLLAVPPVIRLIHDDLHMTETQVGLLIGMPLLMFALAAVPGSLLIARAGAGASRSAGLSSHRSPPPAAPRRSTCGRSMP